MYTIENKIKRYRQIEDLTQEELAQALNVSRQTIIALEKGGYEPSLKLAYSIACYFNVTIETLFQFIPKNK